MSRRKVKTYAVYGDFKDGLFWPDGEPSYTYQRAIVGAYDEDHAIRLCEKQFGEAEEDINAERIPHTLGVHH